MLSPGEEKSALWRGVCVCVHMYVCAYTRVFTCMCVHVCVCAHVFVYVLVYAAGNQF